MQLSHSTIKYSIVCCLFTLLTALPAIAAPERGNPVGKVIVARGDVTARVGDAEPRPLERRSAIHQGETIVTGRDSRGQLRFEDGAIVALDSGSELVIENYRFDEDDGEDHAVVRLLTGGLRTLSGEVAEKSPENYKVDTPLASIGVRGTDYQLSLNDKQLNVAVWSGQVVVANEAGELPLGQNANYRYATVTDRGLPPEGQLEPPEPVDQGDVDTESVETDEDSEQDSQTTDETAEAGSSTEETEDELGFEESGALGASLESEVEMEAKMEVDDEVNDELDDEVGDDTDRIAPWIPDTIDQKTLGVSASLVEVGSAADRVFVTYSTRLDPEQTQYVGEAPDGMYISLEGAGLDRFAENVGGYGINWGAWNGQPDLLVHEDEFDEEGRVKEPLGDPLFLASAPSVSFDEVQDLRGSGDAVQFELVGAFMGQMQDDAAGFDTPYSDPSVEVAGFMNLDTGTGDLGGTISVSQGGGDFRWDASLVSNIDHSGVAMFDGVAIFDVANLEYSGATQAVGEARGVVVLDEPNDNLGFLTNFHFQTEDGSASTTGIMLLEEP